MAAIAMTWWALVMLVRAPKPLLRFAASCPKRKSAGSSFQKTRSGYFESDASLVFPFAGLIQDSGKFSRITFRTAPGSDLRYWSTVFASLRIVDCQKNGAQ